MIVIVDYGMGNLFSIKKAFQRIGIDTVISNKKEDIEGAEKLVLPGVGHFGRGMENLRKLDLVEIITHKVISDKSPILGICLGMQLLTNYSEEGLCNGLGFVNFNVEKFKISGLKIPHMGWNSVKHEKDFSLFEGISDKKLFYFVHSYHIEKKSDVDISCSFTKYGYTFVSAFYKENIFGVQFHPEKSHDQGLDLLKNFALL